MGIKVFTFFLIVCASLALHAEAMTGQRIKQEIAKLAQYIGMYGDDNKIAMITSDASGPDNVTGEVTFKLFTKKNKKNGQELTFDHSTISNSNFDASKRTYIVTHGWRNSGESPACTLIRDAYLTNPDPVRSDCNVIVVDWNIYSKEFNYVWVTFQVETVGKTVAKMIEHLYRHRMRPEDVTLVGHSLGAHVMGIAGHNVQPAIVKNIVGLDPALPMFNVATAGQALTSSDAEHVQIIHTNGGTLGYICSRGHSDFFPNGGIKQTGCCNGNSVDCSACSHARAYELFAESITSKFSAARMTFFGPRLDAGFMGGLDLDKVISGTYYLPTAAEKPFSIAKPRPLLLASLAPLATAACEALKKATFTSETS